MVLCLSFPNPARPHLSAYYYLSPGCWIAPSTSLALFRLVRGNLLLFLLALFLPHLEPPSSPFFRASLPAPKRTYLGYPGTAAFRLLDGFGTPHPTRDARPHIRRKRQQPLVKGFSPSEREKESGTGPPHFGRLERGARRDKHHRHTTEISVSLYHAHPPVFKGEEASRARAEDDGMMTPSMDFASTTLV